MMVIINSRVTIDMNYISGISFSKYDGTYNTALINMEDIGVANSIEDMLEDNNVPFQRFGGQVGKTFKVMYESLLIYK